MWYQPFRINTIGSLKIRVPVKELEAMLPGIELIRYPFIPVKGLTNDHLEIIIDVLGNPDNPEVKYILEKIDRLRKKEDGSEIEHMVSAIIGG